MQVVRVAILSHQLQRNWNCKKNKDKDFSSSQKDTDAFEKASKIILSTPCLKIFQELPLKQFLPYIHTAFIGTADPVICSANFWRGKGFVLSTGSVYDTNEIKYIVDSEGVCRLTHKGCNKY